MDSIWQVQERISFEDMKIEKFKRLLSQSTPVNQVYVFEKVETIYANFVKKPKARPFAKTEAQQIYLALIEFLELPEIEQAKRIKLARQYKSEGMKIR